MNPHVTVDTIVSDTFKWNNTCLGKRNYSNIIKKLSTKCTRLLELLLYSDLNIKEVSCYLDLLDFHVTELILFNKDTDIKTVSSNLDLETGIHELVTKSIAGWYVSAFGTPEKALNYYFMTSSLPNGTSLQQVNVKNYLLYLKGN